MTIKTRLVISYLAMVIVPIILIYFTITLIGNIALGTYPPHGTLYLGFSLSNQENEKILNNYFRLIESDNDLLLDKSFVTTMEEKLKIGAFRTGIAIRKNNAFVYTSHFLPQNMLNLLPLVGDINQQQFNNKYEKTGFALNRQLKLRFNDGTTGMVFIFGGFDNHYQLFKTFFISSILAIILIMLLVNGLLTYLMANSIIKPLKLLKNAAGQIKDGNLDFTITKKPKDEIGELAIAFEEMRGRLKDSIDRQLKYENNRKELISGISHDLKTPVTAIKGYVEGIMDGVADTPDKMAKYLKTIHTKTVNLDHLIDDLFLFSKLDLKKLPFEFENLDIQAFLLDCLEEFQIDLEKKGIELNFNSNANSTVHIIADRGKLKRVISNIIDNCEKYMDEAKDSKQILIELNELPETVNIKISDNGRGIDSKDLPLIFDSFYRVDQSRSNIPDGSGLGLAIAKRIIEEHHAVIRAESQVGIGTVISLNIKKVNPDGESL